jgi:competence protein ComEA
VTWSPRALRALAVLLGALLLVVAYWWWQGRARPLVSLPEVSPTLVSTAMPPPAAEVTVHVRGRVRQPGVISLPVGSRVIDAIEAAGGLRPGVSTGALNLARLLVDGEQVAVGIRDTGMQPAPIDKTAPGAVSSLPLVDINAASAAELEALPGIGPVLAGRIVQWRTDNGPFSDVEILGEVSGIGDALLAQIRPLIRVG